MSKNVVDDAIRRSNLVWLVLGTVCIVAVIIAGVYFADYLYNFIQGPFELTGTQVLAAENSETFREDWVTVEGEEVYETGYQYYSTDSNGNEEILANYVALQYRDRLLLVEANSDLATALKTSFTGKLIDIPSDIQREVIYDIVSEEPDLKDVFLPVMLDARTNYREDGYIGLAIATVVVLIGLYALSRTMRYNLNPSSHPIMNKLSWFGDPRAIADQINYEFDQKTDKIHSLAFTRHWIVNSSSQGFDVTRIQDVAWIYQEVTKHRKYGVIVVNKTYALILWDRQGNKMTINNSKKKVEEMLAYAVKRIPWAITGYDDKINTLWTEEHNNFLAEVDHRRQVLREKIKERRAMQTA